MSAHRRGSHRKSKGQRLGLVEWIANVRDKRKEFRRLKRKNLMVEAVLTSTLIKATTELRMKELQLRQRKQHVKVELYKTDCLQCQLQ
jgi:hypothetical protein